MLNTEDRRAIDGLFNRLRDVERSAEPRDAEAEALIEQKIAEQPAAPYYLAQTVVVQEQALLIAERRIKELEAEVEEGRRDPFGSIFGGRRQTQRQDRYDEPRGGQRSPWDRDDRSAYDDRRGGGGFLAGAAQTALGVAGGVLLGSAIGSMFGAGSAHAAEAPQPDQNAESNTDSGNDNSSSDAGDAGDGGDFGDGGGFDGGGFDMGGDF
jgi:uncharacterized protein